MSLSEASSLIMGIVPFPFLLPCLPFILPCLPFLLPFLLRNALKTFTGSLLKPSGGKLFNEFHMNGGDGFVLYVAIDSEEIGV